MVRNANGRHASGRRAHPLRRSAFVVLLAFAACTGSNQPFSDRVSYAGVGGIRQSVARRAIDRAHGEGEVEAFVSTHPVERAVVSPEDGALRVVFVLKTPFEGPVPVSDCPEHEREPVGALTWLVSSDGSAVLASSPQWGSERCPTPTTRALR